MHEWLLRNTVREIAGSGEVPRCVAEAVEELLEDAGWAIAAAGPSLELLDALGERVDETAARLLAGLN